MGAPDGGACFWRSAGWGGPGPSAAADPQSAAPAGTDRGPPGGPARRQGQRPWGQDGRTATYLRVVSAIHLTRVRSLHDVVLGVHLLGGGGLGPPGGSPGRLRSAWRASWPPSWAPRSRRIAGNGPLGAQATKKLVRMAAFEPAEDVWALHGELQRKVFGSEDAREGATAFVEQRGPVWKGR